MFDVVGIMGAGRKPRGENGVREANRMDTLGKRQAERS